MYGFRSTSSGSKTASAQISTNPGTLSGIDAAPPFSGCTTIILYDSENSSTSGKLVLAEIHLDAGHISVNHEYFSPVAVNRGIFAEMTTTGLDDSDTDAVYVVRFAIG